jgi:hypothetical protein
VSSYPHPRRIRGFDGLSSWRVHAAAMVAALYASGACAVDIGGVDFSLSGFGTLGIVHSSEAQADFVGSFFQPNGAGFTHRWSAGVDSKLGLQMDAHFNDRFSAVVQVVAQHQYDNHYWPDLEWANLKYQFSPDVSVRVGRTVSPFFMVSDSGLVGYTLPWVRPPLEFYGLLPLNHTDGIDATYRFRLNEVTSSIRASYGQFTTNTTGGGEARATHLFNISDTLEYGPGALRFGYLSSRVSIRNPGLDALFAGFVQFGQTLSTIPGLQATGARALALADRYRVSNAPYSIITVGASLDPGRWMLMTEWGKGDASAAASNATAWYATGGYRIGAFTPFVTLAQLESDKPSEPGISITGLPTPLAEAAGALNGGLDAVLNAFAASQRSVSAGVRWDFMRSAALKLQYDFLHLDAGSNGRLINVQPGFQPGSDLTLFNATIDFVF